MATATVGPRISEGESENVRNSRSTLLLVGSRWRRASQQPALNATGAGNFLHWL